LFPSSSITKSGDFNVNADQHRAFARRKAVAMTTVKKKKKTAPHNGAPRESKVTEIGDALICMESYRSKKLGLRKPLTIYSVRGDVAHKLIAGLSREDAQAFMASRLHRQTQDERDAILLQAERRAANVKEDMGAAPAATEQHFEWAFQGWIMHSQADRHRKVWEPMPNGRGRRQVLHVFDWKSTYTVKEEHWSTVKLHSLVTVESLSWEGPVRMVIKPMQGRRGEHKTRRFTAEMHEETKQRLEGIVRELERLWDLEIERLLEVLRASNRLTPELEALAETDGFAVVTRKEFHPIWDQEVVDPNANFRPKGGSPCVECRRFGVCQTGRDWVMGNVPKSKWPKALTADLAAAEEREWSADLTASLVALTGGKADADAAAEPSQLELDAVPLLTALDDDGVEPADVLGTDSEELAVLGPPHADFGLG
jgi:hypothetical protein